MSANRSSPRATCSWAITMSMPVTSSVTGVLDLNPRIDLDEVEFAVFVEVFHGAGIFVTDQCHKADP